MLQRLRQISISSSLRGAFLTGALLTLIVSSVSLYSWHEQSSQIRYSLDEYFPRIHAAFLIEGNLNLVVDQLNEFLLAPNTTVRLQLRNQIIQHLDKIERLSQGLSPAERQQLGVILQDSRALLAELDRVLYNMFLVREKVGELAARIDWLHDDFTTELNSLVQDFTWQQGTLLDQIEARQGDARQYLKRAREVQNEQQQVYTLARIENQIVDDLRDRLNELKSGNDDGMLVETHIRYLENLKKTADENIRALDDWPSTITLRQTIDELLEIGMVKNNMPDTMRDYVSAQKALVEASRSREATLGRFRTLLEAQLGSSHQQMQMFNQRMAQIVRVSGGLILVATLLALLLAWGLNHYFIRSRLVKRFTALNQAVVQIGLGRTEATIPVYGRDELGRIAGLLRHTLGQLNAQKQQLEQEIGERKAIEADLRATQDELIQTAKLAVVGQTMTTLAHEINQPLNALSMYLPISSKAQGCPRKLLVAGFSRVAAVNASFWRQKSISLWGQVRTIAGFLRIIFARPARTVCDGLRPTILTSIRCITSIVIRRGKRSGRPWNCLFSRERFFISVAAISRAGTLRLRSQSPRPVISWAWSPSKVFII